MSIVIQNSGQKAAQKNKKSRGGAQNQGGKKKNGGRRKSRASNNQNQMTRQASRPREISVHPCVAAFAACVANPWSYFDQPQDVCIPDDNDVPSFKFRVRQRGTMTTGSTLGFIVANPMGFANADLNSIFFSNSNLFSGSVVPPTGPTPTGTAYASSTSPLRGGSTGACPLVRCVALGIRIRYSGTELNRGGSVIPFRARALRNTEVLTSKGFSDVVSANQASVQPVKRRWIGTVWTPQFPQEREYRQVSDFWDVSQFNEARNIGILIAPAAQATFDYDIVGVYEAITQSEAGSVLYPVPSVSASDSDVDGYSFVRDVYGKISDSEIGQGLWTAIKSAAKTYATTQVPFSQAAAPMLEWI